jgi:hypothetical protein
MLVGLTFNRLYGVMSQKIELFITTNVRTSIPNTDKTITGGIYLKYKMMPKAVLLEFLDIITHLIFFAVA